MEQALIVLIYLHGQCKTQTAACGLQTGHKTRYKKWVEDLMQPTVLVNCIPYFLMTGRN